MTKIKQIHLLAKAHDTLLAKLDAEYFLNNYSSSKIGYIMAHKLRNNTAIFEIVYQVGKRKI